MRADVVEVARGFLKPVVELTGQAGDLVDPALDLGEPAGQPRYSLSERRGALDQFVQLFANLRRRLTSELL
ncbi:Uncharacterised protein [Mycobacteroides abscessus subsp. massiliense]|nr:Uncharacterised protein [Mycobacteroides abscessus subsp. massiliense]